jgi:hypothetical protein
LDTRDKKVKVINAEAKRIDSHKGGESVESVDRKEEN